MRYPEDPNAYTRQWKYVETAVWRWNRKKKEKTVMRDKVGMVKNGESAFLEWDEVYAHAEKYNNEGIYTSVFRYNKPAVEGSTVLGNLYFDLDSNDVEDSLADAIKLVDFFLEFMNEDDIRIYFTGLKGFHVEIEAIALGITPSNDLPQIFRWIANDLKEKLDLHTIDFVVYDRRRMWRLPNTKHQKTGLYKVEIHKEDLLHPAGIEHIKGLANRPFDSCEFRENSFNMKGNEWYREYLYRIEESKKPQYTAQDLIDRFNKHGTGVLKKVDESSREFNPKELLENCHAITDLWKKAETKNHLEHEERLFLCSILSYTEESLFYLHEILRNCSDYNFEKSQAHISDWIRRREMGIGGRPYTCRRANEAGVGCGDCDLEPKKKWAKVGDSWIETEEFADPSPVRFAYDYNRSK